MYKKDYLVLGGVLDNICNSACQSCNANLSTKIGSLENKNYIKTSNAGLLDQIPMDQVVEIDLNGGEPTASLEYQKLLENLPEQVKIVRVNTNGSRLLPNIENILKKQIQLIITLSLDGVDKVHDYVRWPIKWSKYTQTVQQYTELQKAYKNLKLEAWTTVHALNVGDFDNIVEFAKQNNLDHGWAFLVTPKELDPIYTNEFTADAKKRLLTTEVSSQIATESNNSSALERFIDTQDKLRNISIKDYL
jgi:sulfatase maturation enzyme AslB (radical SAM superfamily)